jgi:hypothetical protein
MCSNVQKLEKLYKSNFLKSNKIIKTACAHAVQKLNTTETK